ncbi:MAG: hypothetical protein ACRC14_14520 [Paracoccaceae bacterium]
MALVEKPGPSCRGGHNPVSPSLLADVRPADAQGSPGAVGTFRTMLVATVASTVLIIAFHRIQAGLIHPFQHNWLGIDWTCLPLINLVHGVRVVIAWMFGWYAVIVLAPGMLYVAYRVTDPSYSMVNQAIMMVILLISAPLTISMLGFFGVRVRKPQDLQFWWRLILLVGITSSVVNALAIHLLASFPSIDRVETMLSLLSGIAAGVAGLAVVGLCLLVFFRLQQRV